MDSQTANAGNPVFDIFKLIEVGLDDIKLDVAKNAKGTVAPGVRVRKGLRQVMRHCRELIKLTVNRDRDLREARKLLKKSKQETAHG